MSSTNEMSLEFFSKSQNESFARVVVAAFIASTNPTLEEVADVKTAVSEAVTNSIIHGYEESVGKIYINVKVDERNVFIEIIDKGKGIINIKQAMEPLYTSKPNEERSGMGFSFMEAFMDTILVESELNKGTVVRMWKEIGANYHHFE